MSREMLRRIETDTKTDLNSFKEVFQTDEKALVRNGQENDRAKFCQ